MDILKRFLIFILFAIALSSILKVFTLGVYPDFGVYYFGSKLFLSGENPYVRHIELFSNYVYPPFVLLFFAPFTLLPIALAAKVWTGISFVSLFACIILSFAILKKKPSLQAFLLVSSIAILSFPVKFTLGMGQINLVILLFVLLGIYFYLKKKNLLSGVFLGISIVLKFFPVLFLPYFLYKKNWRVFLGAMGTIAILLLNSLLITGSNLQIFFFTNVFPGVVSAFQQDYYNQALSGLLARSTSYETGLLLKNVLSLLLLSIVAFVIVKSKRRDDLADICLLLTLSLLINSFSWQHHFVWLMLPFLYTFYLVKKKGKGVLFLLFLSLVLVITNLTQPTRFPIILQSHVFFGTLLLLALQLWVRNRK